MKKSILRNFIIFVFCIFIPYVVFYNFVSDLLYRFMSPSNTLYLGLMIFAATLLYIRGTDQLLSLVKQTNR